ncbi:hypothetical protein V8E54_001836 [Elaphomyces granulatus]
MLAINPFVQQIVKSETRTIVYSEASIPITTTYNPILGSVEEMNMKAAIMAGLLTSTDNWNKFNVQPLCATGNCSWLSYQSLAVCSSCADVTSNLTITPSQDLTTAILLLPNGMSLNVTDSGSSYIMVSVNNTFLELDAWSIAFQNHTESIVNVFLILSNYTWGPSNHLLNTSIGGPYAAECILEWCIQNYTATVHNGNFVESASGSATSAITSWDQDEMARKQVDGVNYTIYKSSFFPLSLYLANVMRGTDIGVMDVDVDRVFDGYQWTDEVSQSMYLHLNETPHTLDALFNNIARSMTLAVRTQAGSTTLVNGKSYTQQIFVSIQWAWISLPFALLILALLFLMGIAHSTRMAGLQPWKGSSIATIFHGLRHLNDDEVHCLIQQHVMDEAAVEIQAILRMDEDGQFLEQAGNSAYGGQHRASKCAGLGTPFDLISITFRRVTALWQSLWVLSMDSH